MYIYINLPHFPSSSGCVRVLGRMMHPDLSLAFSQWRSLVHTNRGDCRRISVETEDVKSSNTDAPQGCSTLGKSQHASSTKSLLVLWQKCCFIVTMLTLGGKGLQNWRLFIYSVYLGVFRYILVILMAFLPQANEYGQFRSVYIQRKHKDSHLSKRFYNNFFWKIIWLQLLK